MNDPVNHPDHYNTADLEPVDVTELFNVNAHVSHALKYILRAPHKGNERRDIEKAIWWLQRWLKFDEEGPRRIIQIPKHQLDEENDNETVS